MNQLPHETRREIIRLMHCNLRDEAAKVYREQQCCSDFWAHYAVDTIYQEAKA